MGTLSQSAPDYWYVTDQDGMKFFRDEDRITSVEWRASAPKEKLEILKRHLAENPNLREATITQ